jgi:hypothetical protein
MLPLSLQVFTPSYARPNEEAVSWRDSLVLRSANGTTPVSWASIRLSKQWTNKNPSLRTGEENRSFLSAVN